MTVQEFLNKPLAEAIQDMNLVNAKVHNDEAGNIKSVELKYVPKDVVPDKTQTPKQNWR